MGREFTYLSSHATNRYFIPNWGKLWDSEWNSWIRCWCSIRFNEVLDNKKHWNTNVWKKKIHIFVTDTKVNAYLYKQGRSIGKNLTGIHQNELWESNLGGNTQSLRPVKSRIGVLFPVQAEFVCGYCAQICISSPAVGKKFQFTAGSFPEFIDQYYGRVIFALIRLRLVCVTPK